MKLTIVESDLLFGRNEFSPLNDIVDGFDLGSIDDSMNVREIFDWTKSTLDNEIFMHQDFIIESRFGPIEYS